MRNFPCWFLFHCLFLSSSLSFIRWLARLLKSQFSAPFQFWSCATAAAATTTKTKIYKHRSTTHNSWRWKILADFNVVVSCKKFCFYYSYEIKCNVYFSYEYRIFFRTVVWLKCRLSGMLSILSTTPCCALLFFLSLFLSLFLAHFLFISFKRGRW